MVCCGQSKTPITLRRFAKVLVGEFGAPGGFLFAKVMLNSWDRSDETLVLEPRVVPLTVHLFACIRVHEMDGLDGVILLTWQNSRPLHL